MEEGENEYQLQPHTLCSNGGYRSSYEPSSSKFLQEDRSSDSGGAAARMYLKKWIWATQEVVCDGHTTGSRLRWT